MSFRGEYRIIEDSMMGWYYVQGLFSSFGKLKWKTLEHYCVAACIPAWREKIYDSITEARQDVAAGCFATGRYKRPPLIVHAIDPQWDNDYHKAMKDMGVKE